MPMGASITEGFCDAPENCVVGELKTPATSKLAACDWSMNATNPGGFGYRKPLLEKLTENNIQVNYVGSVDVVEGFAHEGHSTWTTWDLDYCVQNADWMESAQPDIILLYTGVNDTSPTFYRTPEKMAEDLTMLLTHIYEKVPATTAVIVAQLTLLENSEDKPAYAAQNEKIIAYNALIPGIVTTFQEAGKQVSYVDMIGTIHSNDEYDGLGVHPNKVAAARMADVWLSGIMEILKQ